MIPHHTLIEVHYLFKNALEKIYSLPRHRQLQGKPCDQENIPCPRVVLVKRQGMGSIPSNQRVRLRGRTFPTCHGNCRSGTDLQSYAREGFFSQYLNGLIRSLPDHVFRNFFWSKASLFLSMKYTARPSLWARMDRAFDLPCFLMSLSSNLFAGSLPLGKKTAASEKAHLRWTFPILAPPEPHFFPLDSFAHFTRRLYEAKSCTLVYSKIRDEIIKALFLLVKSVVSCWKRRFAHWSSRPFESIFLPPGLSRGITWCTDTGFNKADDSWHF